MRKPFHPGTGTPPAYVAGREMERERIGEALEFTTAEADSRGRVPETEPPIVIMGPRGVGKTLMLGLSIKKAEELGVRPIRLTSKMITRHHELMLERITPPRNWKRVLSKIPGKAEVGVGPLSAGYTPSIHRIQSLLVEALELAVKDKPVLLVVDEAHSIPAEELGYLCETVQDLIYTGHRITMILAGTPGLSERLMNIEATFMERSRKLWINLLSEKQTSDAFSLGLKAVGMKVEKNALSKLVKWSNRYPYFIQLVGEAAWYCATKAGRKAVNLSDVKTGIASVTAVRNNFYQTRFSELVKDELDSHALQVIKLHRSNKKKGLVEKKLVTGLAESNESMDFKEAYSVYQRLFDLGFIYYNGEFLEPGIPSLFDYVVDRANP